MKVGILFLDLSKAFDTVPINLLCRKLEMYGLRGRVCDWMKSYLTDRKQYVQVVENQNVIKSDLM